MKPVHILLGLFLVVVSGMTSAMGQGCSDAGVCTAGPIGELHLAGDTTASVSAHPHMARLTFSYAKGERGTTILQGVTEVGFMLTERFGLQMKVPYMHVDGDLGSNGGLGDPVFSASWAFVAEKERRLDAMVGVKLPANEASATVDGKPLPMPYQTSLGTTDLLFGLNYRHKRITAALAYQHVLRHGNANGFTHNRWMDDMRALGYFESAGLERADDAVARLQYVFTMKRFAVQPGLLAILHMGRDKRLDLTPDPAGNLFFPGFVEVPGSEGLTLNLTLDARYRLSERVAFELAYGSPLLVREVRPDGLTRSMVLNLSVRYAF